MLVSVRSRAECRQVLDAQVDLIDIKEPLNGSLAAAERPTIEEILE